MSEVEDLKDIIGAAHEALSHHDYDDPEHVITMHTKDLPDAYREACKALGAAIRILCVEDVGGGTLADRGLVRLEAVVKYLRQREAKLLERAKTEGGAQITSKDEWLSEPAIRWRKGLQDEAAIVQEIADELEGGVLNYP